MGQERYRLTTCMKISLWESQITNPRIWSIDHLAIWLKFKYNIKLNQYLHTKYNRDIVLVSPLVALISHSDCIVA